MQGVWIRLGQALAVGALAVGVVGVYLHYTRLTGDLLTSAVAFAPFLMAVAAVGLVVALGLRRWWIAATGAVIVVVAGLTQAPLYLPSAAEAPGTFTVLQSNLGLGNGDVDALAGLVQSHRVDVLTVTELTEPALARIRASPIVDRLPYSFTQPARAGNGGGVFSRYPIVEQERLPVFWLPNLRLVLDGPGGRRQVVYGVHLMPPYPAESAQWRRELDALSRSLSAETLPVIVAGDFNATYEHRQFRTLLADYGRHPGMIDAAEFTGAGMVPTYPSDRWFPALLGLDRVLSRGGPEPVALRRLPLPGADHYAVLARFGGATGH